MQALSKKATNPVRLQISARYLILTKASSRAQAAAKALAKLETNSPQARFRRFLTHT